MSQIAPNNLRIEAFSEPGRESRQFHEGVEKLIRHQFQCLLQVVSLECAAEEVSSRADKQPVGLPAGLTEEKRANVKSNPYQYLPAFQYSEPRLLMIGRFLQCVTALCRFAKGGRSARIAGFRLANLDWWSKYEVGSIIDALGCICSYCDAKCEFCFRKGSPLDRFKHKMLSRPEAESIIKYYNIKKGTGLPVTLHDTGEFLLNKDIFDILKRVRRKDPKVMINDLTTNGNHLNSGVISRLADLKPIFLVISVNAINQEIRSQVMKGKRSKFDLGAVPLLRDHGIPYIGSIVPWPDMPFEEIRETVKYLDHNEAFLIRICLPSYSRFSHPLPPFNPQNYWQEITNLMEEVRGDISTPLLIQPSWYLRQEIKAHVDGVIRNSPACKAGIRFGDQILSVNGKTVVTRRNVVQELVSLHKENQEASVVVLRNGKEMIFTLKEYDSENEDHYPYKPRGYFSDPRTLFGIHFIDGFPLESILEMTRIINKQPEANDILVFTTRLGQRLFYRSFEMLIRSESLEIPIEKIRVTMADHRYWGGNIMVGDLHVVQDYIEHIRKLQKAGYNPDLVLIPSSFTLGQWKLDVLGNSYLEIERQTGCRVELVGTAAVKI
jgi:sulfatase maturation enzyme AslB (radical SAM superfamily)